MSVKDLNMFLRSGICEVRGYLVSTAVVSTETEDKQAVLMTHMQNMDLEELKVPENA